MSSATNTHQGQLLRELLAHWNNQHYKRATGGLWALAGFALQTSVYLLRFFQEVQKGIGPGQSAEMERLSDIICPADGRLLLIQVKRTLTTPALVAAVKEAYLITHLCQHETPALLRHLRFQIACQERETKVNVADLCMSEVIESGDAASWDAMLGLFDPAAPITEERDTLDQLHTFLWNAGIKNVTALIERCAGRLLMSFGTSDPVALRQMGGELADYFLSAERHSPWEPVGDVLTVADMAPDPKASEYTEVLTGQQPRLEHLTKGFFRDRPHIFQMLWGTFTRWVSSIEASESVLNDRMPVFWIDGRSGEGKSVLLLQLVAEALRSGAAMSLLHLKGGDDLPRLLTAAPDRAQLSDRSSGRIFAVVDDVYDLHKHDRDEWDTAVLSECDYRTPPVALITCGPTEQREQFAARLGGPFAVTHFEVPTLDIEECKAFLNWYEARTGQERELSELTADNPLLVQLMFELAHGERLSDFARRFRKRLSDMKIFGEARAILAVNALYMDAPLGLLTTNESLDALEYLCKSEQLHFRITPAGGAKGSEGIRLAHPHLAWLLFIEWVEPAPATLAKAWARELVVSLSIFDDGPDAPIASNMLYRLLHTARLSEDGEPDSSQPTANRRELLRELYRVYIARTGGRPSPRTLPRWLELEYELRGLRLVPDPAQCAIALFSDATLAPSIYGSAAMWLWLIAEARAPQEAQQMHDAVREFSLRHSDNPGVVDAIVWLYTKGRDDPAMNQFFIDWLTVNLINPQAYKLIVPLVAASPTNAVVGKLAFDWLAANQGKLQEVLVIIPLVAAHPGDAEMRKLGLDWLVTNESHPQANNLIATLVAANPDDVEVRTQAHTWLISNEAHPASHWALKSLVAANPSDSAMRARALTWLAANEGNPQAFQVIESLVAAHPDDAEVRKLATNWLRANETHPKFYKVLNVVIARTGGAEEWLDRGEQYVKNPSSIHPEQTLGVLLTAGKADPNFIEMTFEFMESIALKSHRSNVLYHLSRALVSNFTNAVQYLDGPYIEQHKKTVCASIAVGMKRMPDTIAAFALNVVDCLAPEHVSNILWNVITRQLEVDYLDDMIARWLVDNHRRRGYGGMLDALHNNPAHWDRLLALGILPRIIIEDFNNRRSLQRSSVECD